MSGKSLGRGRGRIVSAAVASVALASCATTAANNRASDELSRESEAAARAQARRETQQAQQQTLARYRAAVARESSAALTERAFTAGEGFRGAVASAGDVSVSRVANGHSVRFSIGAEQPVECVVLDQQGDLANMLRAVYENIRGNFVRSAIEAVDAGVVGGNGYLDAAFVYNVNSSGRVMVGSVKIRTLTTGDRSAICTHDEPGYRQSFHRAIVPLMRGARPSPRDANYVVSLNDHRIGVQLLRFREEQGITIEETYASTLIARGEADLTAIDSVTIERYTADGALESQREIENTNLTLENNVWQREANTLRYHFEGTHLGRPLSGVAVAHEVLRAATPTISAFARRALASSDALAPTERERFNPANPLTVTRSRIELAQRVDRTHAWLTITSPRRSTRALVGPDGMPTEMHTELGRLTVITRRVDGEPQ
jgi:hypothetical protein